MAKLFGRTCTLTLGTTQIKCVQATSTNGPPEQSAGLALTFRVKKNLKAEPNNVEIKVWNLAPATRLALGQAKVIIVQLDVGYGGDNHTIYLGQLRGATSEIDGPHIITTIASGDSEQAFAAQRVKLAVPAQASPQQILQLAATGLGVGMGNVGQAVLGATASTGGPSRTLMGSASKIFGAHARANGLEWSVQDGNLQVMPIGTTIGSSATAVLLSAGTGLIGSPSVDNKGILKCESLIQPGLTPGLPVVVQAANVNGAFRIEDSEFSGATWGADWKVTIHARKWK